MNIVIINCHTSNRGDEAAIHALVDELNVLYDKPTIQLFLRGNVIYPNMPNNVEMITQFIPGDFKSLVAYYLCLLSKGRIKVSSTGKKLMLAIEKADIILHAPGGPSIGDTYYEAEPTYLRIFDLIESMHKPYMFYAPSMGPFNKTERNAWRKRVIRGAEAVVLRDPISAEHVKKLVPEKPIYLTLDSAIQHDIDIVENADKMERYGELKAFLSKHEKCVGITITDLRWHPVHSKNEAIIRNIHDSFNTYMKELVDQRYGIIFIPQLYGNGNDYDLMNGFATDKEHFFIIPDNDVRYDTYFQQYLIGQLYAVIGMRYHSNIFSAKMGTPFISVSYEQKMQGFMEKMNLCEYYIGLNDLSADKLKEKFELLTINYDKYKHYLVEKHDEMRKDAYRTTEIVKEVLERTIRGK